MSSTTTPTTPSLSSPLSSSSKTVVIAGATGYIGKSVVRESVKRGYNTIALVRSLEKITSDEGRKLYENELAGATIVQCDVENPDEVTRVVAEASGGGGVDTIVSCLASRSGIKKEAYAIDYRATLNCLEAGREVGARHFVLLSAFCVRRPLLQLQRAKLKFEAALAAQSDLTYSIVRPTAFMKSISGQLEGIQQGAPYVLFGDGAVTRCNPISEEELAEYMIDCMTDETRKNKIMNIGGPDVPLTNQMLGEMMYRAVGAEPKFVYAPTWIFDVIINTLQFLADLTKSEALDDAAEVGRIGKYYAVEDMLTTAPEEKYGETTVQDHYNNIAAKGQDPFTPVRATAVIARVIESTPAFLLTLPVLWSFSHPQAIQKAVYDFDYPMMLAAIKSVTLLS
eukprot:CAMPEP_0172494842 /NCGR_PEP_ID=MMETSP1066-20121228/57478_1 /TAXON_ID=671091 /ORGANISM="Coscinodiscus wailesii, Strain CCMP2513" /LENGTH=395 /DNA_ID=CAMNT_0013266135 /DNA_START=245 /DNA_END=1432 /DNA_ORIENTATION=-